MASFENPYNIKPCFYDDIVRALTDYEQAESEQDKAEAIKEMYEVLVHLQSYMDLMED